MSKQHVGGKKRKGWRLKKKYNKWFMRMVLEIAKETLADMPKGIDLWTDNL